MVFPGEDPASKQRSVIKLSGAEGSEKGSAPRDDAKNKGTGVGKDSEEEKRRKRAEKFGTAKVGDEAKADGNGALPSPRNAPKSPRKSPRMAPVKAPAGSDAGMGGGGNGQQAETAGAVAKEKSEPEKKKFKVRIGQRDDLAGSQ